MVECCIVSLSKNINPSLVLVQPRKTCPFITERLLMRRKESNKQKYMLLHQVSHCILKLRVKKRFFFLDFCTPDVTAYTESLQFWVYMTNLGGKSGNALHALTLCLLVPSTDNLCKQFLGRFIFILSPHKCKLWGQSTTTTSYFIPSIYWQ